MKNIDIKIFPLIFLLFSLHLAKGDVRCSNPSAYINRFGGRDQQCVALVQGLCHRSNGRFIGLTQSWRRGRHVRSNCDKIPPYTAIATFLGPNHHFDAPNLEQHTAIFRGCTKQGILVYDQWVGHPCRLRTIPWNGFVRRYSGINYYTIQ